MSLPAKSAGLMLSQLGRRGLSFLLRLSLLLPHSVRLLLLLSTPKNISVPYQASNASHPAASSFAWTFAELREKNTAPRNPQRFVWRLGAAPKLGEAPGSPNQGTAPGQPPIPSAFSSPMARNQRGNPNDQVLPCYCARHTPASFPARTLDELQAPQRAGELASGGEIGARREAWGCPCVSEGTPSPECYILGSAGSTAT